MEIIIQVIAVLLGLIGMVGCFLPVLPGPPLSWAALLLLYIWGPEPMTTTFLIVWLVITIVVTILDYVVPAYFTKATGGSNVSARGSLVGLFIGIIFFPPWGMIVGAFLGALLSEIIFNRTALKESLKPALGSFLGFISGTFIKLVACGVMFFYIIKYL